MQCRRPWFDPWVRKIPWRRDRLPVLVFLGCSYGSAGKESAYNAGAPGSIPGLGRCPGDENGNPTPGFLPGKSHGQRSLVGYSQSIGHKELDSTEHLHTQTYTHIIYNLQCVKSYYHKENKDLSSE